MKKMLNANGEKIKVNKGRLLEMAVYESFGVKYEGIDNIKTQHQCDLYAKGVKYDIKSERGSIITKYGDTRKAKNLTESQKTAFVNEMVDALMKSIDEKRTFLFAIIGLDSNLLYSMNKNQWKAFLKHFAIVDNATDKGEYLKIRLDAKSERAYKKMTDWLTEKNIKTMAI